MSQRTVLGPEQPPPRLPSLALITGRGPTVSSEPSRELLVIPEPSRQLQLTAPLPHPLPVRSLASASQPSARATTSTTTPLLDTGFQPKHRKPKAKRNRKGWGPYKSVLNERSVDFNLQLDIQHLQQEIQQLTTVRDFWRSQVLAARHAPTGSLMQMVREWYQIYRQGYRVEHYSRRRHVITAGVQRDFLYSLVDEHIDLGNGMGGIELMIEMNKRYSLLLRFICMKMDSFEIVVSDDGDEVMIKTKGSLRFQVLRETVRGIFPHILGNEWLCSRLIGAEVEAPSLVTFTFNAKDKLCRYAADADYIAAFSEILRDPQDVLDLLGQSKLDEKSMIGVNEDGRVEAVNVYDDEPDPEQLVYAHELSADLSEQVADASTWQPQPNHKPVSPTSVNQAVGDHRIMHRSAATRDPQATPKRVGDESPTGFSYPDYLSVVGRYMLVFANGWPIDGDDSDQRKFLHQFVSPQVIVGGYGVGHQAIQQLWKSLGTCFELVGFRASAPPQLFDDAADDDDNGRGEVCVHLRVVYTLAIDISTLQRVFPHVLRHPALVQALLGMEIACPSEVWFEWHAGVVTRVRERLHWDEALTPLVPVASQRAFVLTEAALSPEGFVVESMGHP